MTIAASPPPLRDTVRPKGVRSNGVDLDVDDRMGVVFGDALTGHIDPALIVVTAVGVAIGSAGLLVDARLGIEEPESQDPGGSSPRVA